MSALAVTSYALTLARSESRHPTGTLEPGDFTPPAHQGERLLPALGRLLRTHNRRYGGFLVHFGILVIAVGVTGSQAWSLQRETTLKRGEATQFGGYRIRFDRLDERPAATHDQVVGAFTPGAAPRPCSRPRSSIPKSSPRSPRWKM